MRTIKLQILAEDFIDKSGMHTDICSDRCPITKALQRAGYNNFIHNGLDIQNEYGCTVTSNVQELWRIVANMIHPKDFEFSLQIDLAHSDEIHPLAEITTIS